MKTTNYSLYNVRKFRSIKEMMEIAANEAGEKIAYKYKNGDDICEVSFNKCFDDVASLGSFIFKNGLWERRIACIGTNSYKWIVAYLAALRGPGVFIPVDKDLPKQDIIHILNDSEADIVFFDSSYEIFLKTNMDKLQNIETFISFEKGKNEGRFISFECALQEGKTIDHTDFLNNENDTEKLKMLVYTSGTTGNSKGVMLSEKNLVSSVYYGLRVSTVYDTGLSILPYHHTYEAVSNILVSFHHHSTLCINESLSAINKNLILYKPSYIYIVPAIAESIYKRIMRNICKDGMEEKFNAILKTSKDLLAQGIDKRRELFSFIHDALGGRLRKIVCGGAPIRPEVANFFEDTGFDFINGYGITECSPLVSVNHDEYNDYRTVGIKLPCIDLKIDNPNEDGVGEICVKGDIVMLGYYKQPSLTAEVIREGWFYTGDYGYINSSEHLVISGRKKNVIVLANGKNIYPEEIENYIKNIDYINEVIVSSEKDSNGNEKTLTAEVFLAEKRTSEEVLKDIKNICKQLPVYKQISEVKIRETEFPKTSSNKIRRFLRQKN